MGRGADRAKRDAWQQRLLRFSAQGETVSRFCQREQVSVASFYQWQRKLGRSRKSRAGQATLKSTATRGGRKSATPRQYHEPRAVPPASESPVRFLPVEFTGPTSQGACVEVLLPSGVQLRVPCQEAAALSMVLASVGLRWSEDRTC